MSTAIALQDIGSHSHQEQGVIRRRLGTKTEGNVPENSTEDVDGVESPHNLTTSVHSLNSNSFTPSNTYWISPHGMLSKKIEILDLTRDIDVPFTGFSNSYKQLVKTTLKDHSSTPTLTAHCDNWFGTSYTITDSQGEFVAKWKHPWTSVGEATLTFPEDSQHSSHLISLKNKRWGLRTESFVIDSVPFFWEMDSCWHSTNMTLYKTFGSGQSQRRIEVGKYAQKWWGSFVTGGTFVVDEEEIDGLVACLTLVVILKKKRQRAAETKSE